MDRQFNLPGGPLTKTLRPMPKAEAAPELALDAAIMSLPKGIQKFVRAQGVATDTEFAWSWNEAELRKDLEGAGMGGTEIESALIILVAARSGSRAAMASSIVTPSPVAARPAELPCAPAGRERKVRKVHLHGRVPSPTEQSCASGGGAPAAF